MSAGFNGGEAHAAMLRHRERLARLPGTPPPDGGLDATDHIAMQQDAARRAAGQTAQVTIHAPPPL